MSGRKKNGSDKGSIIQLNPGNNDKVWDGSDWDEEDEWDEDDMDDMDGMSEELMSLIMNQLLNGGSGGMTNEQYKGMLLDQLESWKRVKRLAEEEGAKRTAAEIQGQIALINRKLKF